MPARLLSSFVLFEWLSLLPPWLVAGLVLGAAASVAVAGVFVVGARLFPDPPGASGRAGRVDGTARRRREIREYLLSIDEQFVEDYELHDETVAFYLPGREVAITFDARAYYRLEQAGVVTVLCEHEMPGHQLGRRLPFEVPTVESGPDVRDPVAAAFDRLGLGPGASREQVKAAYREQVKDAHPDHGGDHEEFQRVREAYVTAKNHAD
jgi:hypothetical protein